MKKRFKGIVKVLFHALRFSGVAIGNIITKMVIVIESTYQKRDRENYKNASSQKRVLMTGVT